MAWFASSRERRLWVGAAACLAVVYGTIYHGQVVLQALRGRGVLRLTILVLFLAAAAALLLWAARRRPGRREWTVLVLAAVAYVPVVGSRPVLQERLHFLEYGLFAALCEAALRERRRVPPSGLAPRSAAGAFALTAAAGWGDEGIQALVPHRVYDPWDVVLNAAAGLLALAVLAGRRAARARDRRATGADDSGPPATSSATIAASRGGATADP